MCGACPYRQGRCTHCFGHVVPTAVVCSVKIHGHTAGDAGFDAVVDIA